MWALLWACVPLASPFVLTGAIGASGGRIDGPEFGDLMATQAGLAFACLVLLWGSGRVARQAGRLERDLRPLAGDGIATLFSGVRSVRGPLALTAIVAFVLTVNDWVTYGPAPSIAALPVMLVYLLPVTTFLWVYLAVQLDVHRLGRMPLRLDTFPQDPTFSLDGVGTTASTGLALVLLAATPVLVVGSDEPATLGVSLTIVAATLVVFVLSMWRLHGQMASAKERFVAVARGLYAEAYEPMRHDPTIERLEAQATALRAAQALDERARGLQTWPLDEAALRFVVVVVTGVVTSIVVRGLSAAIEF